MLLNIIIFKTAIVGRHVVLHCPPPLVPPTAHHCIFVWGNMATQSAIKYSKLTTETLEQGVKYVQS